MGVKIIDIIRTFSMNSIVEGNPDIEVSENELNRSGLQLAGYYGYFVEKRIQLLGNAEISYLNSLDHGIRESSIDKLLQHDIPCIVVTQNNPVPEELLRYGKKYGRWVLSTSMPTSNFHVDVTSYLQNLLADSMYFHGELLDVSGVGILIQGKSGIGKSETALELVRRGHLLIADDCVVIRKPRPDVLVGTGEELTKDLIELRGVGIIDVKSIFGIRSIRMQKNIEMVVELVEWKEDTDYDRLGDSYKLTKIMDIEVPITHIPVLPGRNLAIIIEVIALNYRQNLLGYNAALQLDERIVNMSNNKK